MAVLVPLTLISGITVHHMAKLKHYGILLLHRASYYEISVDDGPWEKQKSSGLSICTGTGSKAWYGCMDVFLNIFYHFQEHFIDFCSQTFSYYG